MKTKYVTHAALTGAFHLKDHHQTPMFTAVLDAIEFYYGKRREYPLKLLNSRRTGPGPGWYGFQQSYLMTLNAGRLFDTFTVHMSEYTERNRKFLAPFRISHYRNMVRWDRRSHHLNPGWKEITEVVEVLIASLRKESTRPFELVESKKFITALGRPIYKDNNSYYVLTLRERDTMNIVEFVLVHGPRAQDVERLGPKCEIIGRKSHTHFNVPVVSPVRKRKPAVAA